MSSDFEWPIPPHFELITKSESASSDQSPCMVVMNDLRRQVGNMVCLDPTASILEFHPERAASNINIGFSSFKTLRLTEPIELKRLQLPPGAENIEAYPTSMKQKCIVRFKAGS